MRNQSHKGEKKELKITGNTAQAGVGECRGVKGKKTEIKQGRDLK